MRDATAWGLGREPRARQRARSVASSFLRSAAYHLPATGSCFSYTDTARVFRGLISCASHHRERTAPTRRL